MHDVQGADAGMPHLRGGEVVKGGSRTIVVAIVPAHSLVIGDGFTLLRCSKAYTRAGHRFDKM